MGLKKKLHTLKEKYRGTKMAPAFNAFHTFLYMPNMTTESGSHIRAADDLKRTMNTVIMALVPVLLFGIFNTGYQHSKTGTSAIITVFMVRLRSSAARICDTLSVESGSHIRAADDLKRTMNTVIMALVPVLLFGIFNTGYQHYAAIDAANGITREVSLLENFLTWENFSLGALKVLPLVLISYGVGLGIEFIFAIIYVHEVEAGYLVTGMLVPLIVPVDIPLWMLVIAIVFGVVIGKEVFGGTGMNILNPALTIRAFLFFAYPTWMSGDKVWVHGAREMAGTPDAISGETVLGKLAQGNEVTTSIADMFFGFMPGSIGETSTFLILIGTLFLLFTKIASWRIMLSSVIGALVMGLIFNGVVSAGWIGTNSPFYTLMDTTFWHHLLIGGFA